MLVANMDFCLENKDSPGNQQARVGNLGEAILSIDTVDFMSLFLFMEPRT